jgi:hypothetical protein
VCTVQELQPGDPQQIGPYRITGRLGSGGMGTVYLGRSADGRLVAVRVIREELSADPEFRLRFRHEVSAARGVSGMFTAPVVDADTDGRWLWLACAYVAGPSLEAAVGQHGPLPAASVLALAAGLAEGLAGIHTAGVVHRDLRPANILLAGNGPRIIDFGISSARYASGPHGYLSPEQAGGGRAGSASDVFSLGAVLAFAATGRPDTDGLPWELRPLVERCLAEDPMRRPGAREILAMLPSPGVAPAPFSHRPLEQGPFGLPPAAPAPFVRAAPFRPATAAVGLLEAAPPEAPVRRRASGTRSKPLIAGVAAGAVAVLAAAVFAAVRLIPAGHDSALDHPARTTSATAAVAAKGPQYALRGNPCKFVKAATLKKYFPGVDGTSDDKYSGQDECQWNTQNNHSLSIDVQLYDVSASASANDADAQENYRACVQALDKSGDGTKITGTQRVAGLGSQATAIFENDTTAGAQVSLCVWSGDVQLQNAVEASSAPAGAAAVRKLQASQLAASIAVARDILSDLPRAKSPLAKSPLAKFGGR